jgi:cysteine desulfurase family protein
MIYLNNTATSFPKPKVVNDALVEYLNHPPVHSSRSGLDVDDDDIVSNCRQKLCRLVNSDAPENMVLTSGSTESLNMAIKGIDMEGGHVVSTEIEHNSVIRPLKTLEEEGKISVDFAPCDKWGYVSPESIESLIRPNTKAVVVNHCSNVTGTVLDLQKIAAIAHKNGAVIIVDASQSAGLVPIDVKSWEIDYLAITGHKNLFGMPGTGALYMKDKFSLKPLKTGGTGVKSEVLTQPRYMPMFYECGTPNLPGIVSLDAGIGFVLETGIEKISSHKAEMTLSIINELKSIESVIIHTSLENNSLSNFCFNIDGMVPEEVNYVLESSYDIHVRSGLHCAPLLLKSLGVHPWGTVRASSSYFTEQWEIEKFINAIKDIVATFVRKKK